MDLLGKMVGAPGLSSAALAETRTDAELIADIAPAMLIKLREDGMGKGAVWSFLPMMLWTAFTKPHWGQIELDATPLWQWVVLPLLIAAVAMPYFFKHRSVLVEVRYRRQHGKWRWER
jgi:hypothetical protein